jgi:hypothetical protein
MPKLLDRVVDDLDWVKTRLDLDRPSLRLVNLDKGEMDVEPVTFVGALGCPPMGLDLDERSTVILVSSDWPEFHRMLPSELE